VSLPTDRGYVAITETGDGTRRVDIFARRSATGPTNVFATHNGQSEVVVTSKVPFEQNGKTAFSTEIVEVWYDEAANRLYVADPVSTTVAARFLQS